MVGGWQGQSGSKGWGSFSGFLAELPVVGLWCQSSPHTTCMWVHVLFLEAFLEELVPQGSHQAVVIRCECLCLVSSAAVLTAAPDEAVSS